MKITQIFPMILIILQIGAGVICAAKCDVRMAIYWFAAAVLNAAVTV